MRIRNPYGGMLNSELNMDKKNYLKLRIKNALLYDCYGFFAGLRGLKIVFRNPKYRLLKAICLIPGFLMYKLWRFKYT